MASADDIEQHRHMCEARAVLNMRTLAERRHFLFLVEKNRGEPERKRLEKTIMTLWKQRQQHAQS